MGSNSHFVCLKKYALVLEYHSHLGIFDPIGEGEEASVKYFNDWVENVKKIVPSEKLLVFDVKEGWNPLCKFLNVPVPNAPFPWENDTASLRQWFLNFWGPIFQKF